MVSVTAVSISDLKANLSRYLREVRRGGEVQVLDRGKPVARLLAPAVKDDDDLRTRLVSAGVVRPGKGSAARILDEPPLALDPRVSEALTEDRVDRL